MPNIDIYEGSEFFPAVAALEVTLSCNMRCMHCGSNVDGRPRKNEMPLNEWKRVVNELVALGTEYFTLSGGEPFIWPDWRELSRHIRACDKTLSIISNGSLISQDDVDFLADIGASNIAISIDGMEASHDRIRGMAGSFRRAADVLSLIKKTPVRTSVVTSVNKINYDDLSLLRGYLDKIDAGLWQLQVVNSFGRAGALRDVMLVTHDQYAGLVEFINESQKLWRDGRLKLKTMPADSVGYCHGISMDIWDDMEWRGCSAGRHVIGIKSNGDVLGCLSLQGEIFTADNVLERPLAEIWQDDSSFAYNRNFNPNELKGPCNGCCAGRFCRSGCLGMGYSTSGELYSNSYCYKHIMEKRADEPKAI